MPFSTSTDLKTSIQNLLVPTILGRSPFQQSALYHEIMYERNLADILPADYDQYGYHILHWAVLCQQRYAVEKYVTYPNRIDPDQTNQLLPAPGIYNVTPLYLAIERQYTAIATLLLDNGADATVRPYRQKSTSLFNRQTLSKTNLPSPFAMAAKSQQTTIARRLCVPELKSLLMEFQASRAHQSSYCCLLFPGQSLANPSCLAATAFLQLLNNADKVLHQDDLVQLAIGYPAVKQKELGRLFQLAGRFLPEPAETLAPKLATSFS
jgi:hypothetical protein